MKDSIKECSFINPYLTGTKLFFISKMTNSISGFPIMQKGSQPADGGNLILDKSEKDIILDSCPSVANYIKPYLGSSEYIKGEIRYCIWLTDNDYDDANKNSYIKERLEKVALFRQKSTKGSTREWAKKPYSFTECRYLEKECIIVPSTSSEGRKYIPMGMLDKGTIVCFKFCLCHLRCFPLAFWHSHQRDAHDLGSYSWRQIGNTLQIFSWSLLQHFPFPVHPRYQEVRDRGSGNQCSSCSRQLSREDACRPLRPR